MIFTTESGTKQVSNLLRQYNKLAIISQDESLIILSGYIQIDCIAREYRVCKEYHIRIGVPLNSDDLPYVVDDNNQIDQMYPHRYPDGELCIETDSAIRIRFVSGFDLVAWMKDYVEIYFFSYEYYQRFSEFPFGERGHGLEGIIQTYSDLFHEEDNVKTLWLMDAASSQRYRGHCPCPCGSGRRLRLCHGRYLFDFYTNERLNAILKKDFFIVKKGYRVAK